MALEVRVGRRYASAADKVFDAWLDPATARKFLFATDTGKMVRVEFDFSVEAGVATDPVEIDITPSGSGCELVLRTAMKPEYAQHAERARHGWNHILESLARALDEGRQA